jgi:hypothetical protein
LIVTIQHKQYYGNFDEKDVEKSSNATENLTMLIPIRDERMQPHPTFTHIRLLLDEKAKKVTKAYLAGNCKYEDEVLHTVSDSEDITEQIRNTTISKRSCYDESEDDRSPLKKLKGFNNDDTSLYIDI